MSGLLVTENVVEKHPAPAGFTYLEMTHAMDEAERFGVWIRVVQYQAKPSLYVLQCHATRPNPAIADGPPRQLNLTRFVGNYDDAKTTAQAWYHDRGLPFCRGTLECNELHIRGGKNETDRRNAWCRSCGWSDLDESHVALGVSL